MLAAASSKNAPNAENGAPPVIHFETKAATRKRARQLQSKRRPYTEWKSPLHKRTIWEHTVVENHQGVKLQWPKTRKTITVCGGLEAKNILL